MNMLLLAVAPLLLAQAAPTPDAGSGEIVDAGAQLDLAGAAGDAAAAAQLASQAAERAAASVAKLAVSPGPKPPPAPPATVANAAEKPSSSVAIGANLIWLQGNSNTLTVSGTAAASHTFEGGWILSGKGGGAYGTAQAVGGPSQITAEAANGQVRGDKLLVPETSVFLQAGAEADHIASLELRYFAEGGVGLFWLDRKEGDFQKLLLRTDLSLRGQEDYRFNYFPTAADPTVAELPSLVAIGPRFAAAFRYALNKGVIFTEDAGIFLNIDGASRALATSSTKLTTELLSHLSFAVGFGVTYDSEPAIGKVPTDTALTVGLEGSF